MAAFLLHYLQSICTDISRYIPLGPELSRLFSTSYYVTHQAACAARGRGPGTAVPRPPTTPCPCPPRLALSQAFGHISGRC